jgi:hypothetical protein
MKTWTVEEMVYEKPCKDYPVDVIKRLWGDKKSLSLLEILHLNIPDIDKVWVIGRRNALEVKECRVWLELMICRGINNCVLRCGCDYLESFGRGWLISKRCPIEFDFFNFRNRAMFLPNSNISRAIISVGYAVVEFDRWLNWFLNFSAMKISKFMYHSDFHNYGYDPEELEYSRQVQDCVNLLL